MHKKINRIPLSVKVSTATWGEETVLDEELCLDAVSDYLSDTYGFCHKGFEVTIHRDGAGRIIEVVAENIKWDFS